MPTEDRTMRRRSEYVEDIAVAMGGYAAEFTFFGEVTTGASSDMKNATRMARNMVTQWGMSDKLGPRVYGEQEDMIFLGREIHENRDYSDTKAVMIDDEIDELIKQGLETAKRLVSTHKDAMQRIVDELLGHETIERDRFAEVIGIPAANPKNLPA
jgi:cell division protease FtsH